MRSTDAKNLKRKDRIEFFGPGRSLRPEIGHCLCVVKEIETGVNRKMSQLRKARQEPKAFEFLDVVLVQAELNRHAPQRRLLQVIKDGKYVLRAF
jgi:hypothetical protein